MKKWIFFMLLIAILLLGSVIGFNIIKQKKIAEYMANLPEPSYPVTIKTVQNQDWTPVIQAIGFIEPYQGVMLSTESNGVIKKINFESGIEAKKGQVLLTLDSSVEEANLKSAQARLPAAKAKFLRYQDLYRKRSLSKESFDEAEAAYFSLAADIESLKAQINRRTIKAPFSGTVGIRNVYLGQYLQPGTDIVRIEDTNIMRLRFTVPQTQISKISLHQKIEINVDAYPQHVFAGSITAIEPAVSVQSGLIQVEADIPNTDGKLRSGMFARANVLLPVKHDQIVIPQTAITYALYGDSVYVVKKEDGVERVKQAIVKIGARKKDKVRILSGLKKGDIIVTSGQVRLSNEAKVHVVQSDAANPPAEIPML
ncbi:efflux RND transporter periplasmic adaptor subunit [Vibrio salinus]|uniref:efflux RND transporter periplasmic adaptor subunit n=1 Tax=Vibrio salinus TaxID=2899784 RepID=UPI001E31EEB9|nr:efflux RND transporter periplasmic adaptor subunit [Vibrio salinus]MCE0493703.1 efflux RND transporter periplasmic adaptor subunit [Vibrio salinus]